MNRGKRIWSRTGICALASLSTTVVGAQERQDTPSGDAASLEEVLVTARRVEESVRGEVEIAIGAETRVGGGPLVCVEADGREILTALQTEVSDIEQAAGVLPMRHSDLFFQLRSQIDVTRGRLAKAAAEPAPAPGRASRAGALVE